MSISSAMKKRASQALTVGAVGVASLVPASSFAATITGSGVVSLDGAETTAITQGFNSAAVSILGFTVDIGPAIIPYAVTMIIVGMVFAVVHLRK